MVKCPIHSFNGLAWTQLWICFRRLNIQGTNTISCLLAYLWDSHCIHPFKPFLCEVLSVFLQLQISKPKLGLLTNSLVPCDHQKPLCPGQGSHGSGVYTGNNVKKKSSKMGWHSITGNQAHSFPYREI